VLHLTGSLQTQINGYILGKITRKAKGFTQRGDYIFLTNGEKVAHGYAAIFTPQPVPDKGVTAVLCDPQELHRLHDGDIVSVQDDGKINILYESSSDHNTLLVTERCNGSCIMCPQSLVSHEEDKTPFILRIISLIDQKAQVLGITGGEPTLLGDRLIKIVRECKERLPRTQLALLSNGIRFEDFDYVKELMLVQHPGLIIDIPLHSDTDTEHDKIIGVKGFYKTIKGLYNLARFNQKIGIRVVIHRLNYKRLPQFAEFLYRNFPFVFHIAFMQMETIGLARENIDRLWIDPYDYNEELCEAVLHLWRRGMNVSIYNAQLCILPRDLWQFARKSISSWKNIYLDECEKCDCREDCGGFFESSLDLHSKYLKTIRKQ
jgi:His-Xaa-Ser system radical SAM maturase HxsC